VQIFFPNLSLAFEYQGQTHYFSSPLFGSASDRKRIDNIKREFAKQNGITLISVPFWWNKSNKSLQATIKYHRPDFNFDNTGASILLAMPIKFQPKFKYMPSSAKDYTDRIDPTGW
jgi:hypothetical protein